jgi:hypothetical protein
MQSLLQNLDRESILLLYVAGELPADDRASVEGMLAKDVGMRQALEELQSAYAGIECELEAADARERLALPASAAGRRVGMAVRSWHAKRLARPAGAKNGNGRYRVPIWAYPVAAAIAVLFGSIFWWGIRDEGPGSSRFAGTKPLVIEDPNEGDPQQQSPDLATLPSQEQQPGLAPPMFADVSTIVRERDEQDRRLDEVEAAVAGLDRNDDLSSMLISDTDDNF